MERYYTPTKPTILFLLQSSFLIRTTYALILFIENDRVNYGTFIHLSLKKHSLNLLKSGTQMR